MQPNDMPDNLPEATQELVAQLQKLSLLGLYCAGAQPSDPGDTTVQPSIHEGKIMRFIFACSRPRCSTCSLD